MHEPSTGGQDDGQIVLESPYPFTVLQVLIEVMEKEGA
jgi:hypothetical protein